MSYIHKEHFPTQTYRLVATHQLQRGQYQPRKAFDETSLQELAHSILTQGLIEPLIVREITHQHYEIIAGERRWRAAMLANVNEVPCLVGHYTDEQAATLALIENIQREDLNLLEEAEGYQRLLHEFHFTQDEISHLVGKSRSHIANILRLLTLSHEVQTRIQQKELSLGHARVLVGLSQELQMFLARETCEQGWSVRRLEEEVRLSKQKPPSPVSQPINHDLAHLQTQLSEQMGAPIQIISEKDQSGWLKIKFFDNETLTGLLERMGLRYD